ncbi:hypothetical protein OS493_029914, partial [Desmophyllum pertusum]
MTKTRIISWQTLLVLLALGRRTLEQETGSRNSTCPKSCLCNFCPASQLTNLLTVHCGNINLDDFRDLEFQGKICSLDLSWNNVENITSVVFNNMSSAQNL